MTALPISILALAAGVYLLIKVKREFMGTLFSVLAWLVIGLSVANIGLIGVKACQRYCYKNCEGGRECKMEKRVIIKEDGMGHCSEHSSMSCSMSGCKMEGDSMVMEKEACEKMMGAEACATMCKERGRCIMSKDECVKMCHAEGKACCAKESAEGCPMHKEGCKGDCSGKCSGKCESKCDAGKKECCTKGAEPEKKACCKHKM